MTIDEIVALISAKEQKNLIPVQELILRQAWKGQTYSQMAQKSHYQTDYLKKTAFQLWHLLSDTFGEAISKTNFRSSLEPRPLSQQQRELIEQFNSNQPSATKQNLDFLEFPTGPIPLGSIFYIERPPIEELAYSEISKSGSLIRIKGSRKMGKSSLMLRIIARAEVLGYRTVYLDFRQLDDRCLRNPERFLRWFCSNIAWQLGLIPKLDDYWDKEMGSKVSCTIYLKRYLLAQINAPLVLTLEEGDWIFPYLAIAQEFLPLLRSWHEEAKQDEIMRKLRLVVVHSRGVDIPLNIHQSPFNVGLPIKLPPFTVQQVRELANSYQLDWIDDSQAQRLMIMLGGYPYLVQLAFYYLYRQEITMERLLKSAPTITGIYTDYLRSYLVKLKAKPDLFSAFKQVVRAEESIPLTPMLANELESMGLVKLLDDRVAPGCELFRLYFRSQIS
jgi:hypothetical protein